MSAVATYELPRSIGTDARRLLAAMEGPLTTLARQRELLLAATEGPLTTLRHQQEQWIGMLNATAERNLFDYDDRLVTRVVEASLGELIAPEFSVGIVESESWHGPFVGRASRRVLLFEVRVLCKLLEWCIATMFAADHTVGAEFPQPVLYVCLMLASALELSLLFSRGDD